MSTRWYPLYQKGNPQLRIFLPNFWMKLIKPVTKQPKNVVSFHCSMEMTLHDVKNYLEKIYNVKPMMVRTRIALGKTRKCLQQQCIIKDDDMKIAYVVLPKTEQFTFPDIFAAQEDKTPEERFDEYKEQFKKFVDPNKMPGLPSWFRI